MKSFREGGLTALVFAMAIFLGVVWRKTNEGERTAYSRGYAAAVDSVRAMSGDMDDAEAFYVRGDSVTVWYKGHAYVCVQGRELQRVREIRGVAR